MSAAPGAAFHYEIEQTKDENDFTVWERLWVSKSLQLAEDFACWSSGI